MAVRPTFPEKVEKSYENIKVGIESYRPEDTSRETLYRAFVEIPQGNGEDIKESAKTNGLDAEGLLALKQKLQKNRHGRVKGMSTVLYRKLNGKLLSKHGIALKEGVKSNLKDSLKELLRKIETEELEK